MGRPAKRVEDQQEVQILREALVPHGFGVGSEIPDIKEPVVSILVRFAPESLTAEQYDTVVRRLEDEGISPADGLDYEVCFGSGDNMRVSLVFDSQEHLDAFAARLMPILAEYGIDPGQPEVLPVHNTIKR